MTKNLVLWLIIAAVLLTVFNNFSQEAAPNRVSYSEFVQAVQRDQVRNVEVDGIIINGKFGDGTSFEVSDQHCQILSWLMICSLTKLKLWANSQSNKAFGCSYW